MMTWTYHDAAGAPSFQHYRIAQLPTDDDPRAKRYGYRYPEYPDGRVSASEGWVWRKPENADSLLYRLPAVLRQPHRTLVLTEGERDCAEFVRRGVLASCHHGGAGKFTSDQAASLAAHHGDVVLVADHDGAGALDVTHRYMHLRRVGFKPHRLTILQPATGLGSDARDHFEAGYDLDDFNVSSYAEMVGLFNDHGAALEGAGYFGVTEDERAQLASWKPVTA